MSASPIDHLKAIIAEVRRRDDLLALVEKAGFHKAPTDSGQWVARAEVTRAVAALADRDATRGLGSELRRVLLDAGWRERICRGTWQWRATFKNPAPPPVKSKGKGRR